MVMEMDTFIFGRTISIHCLVQYQDTCPYCKLIAMSGNIVVFSLAFYKLFALSMWRDKQCGGTNKELFWSIVAPVKIDFGEELLEF